MTNQAIDSATFGKWLDDGAELAVLDVRSKEEAVGYGQPLFGTNVPAEVLLQEIERSVPRAQVRTVLVDGGDGVAERLAGDLAKSGRPNVFALSGGFPAWLQSDQFSRSFDIPGRDFSLGVQRERNTPSITVQQLEERRQRGDEIVVIDTRTVPEFTRDHVPGAINVPGAELLLRLVDVVPSRQTQIVVSCAGLPRAILGAQTLIDAGVENPVVYLEDGTAAWRRAGWPLEEGLTAKYGPTSAAARKSGHDYAARLSTAGQFREIDLDTATVLASDPDRTTYLLDVRTPEEYAAEHIEGSISAEGGQLLGLSSRTIATRGSRLVLIDDVDGIRAKTVAHWLSRRDYEIVILRHSFARSETDALKVAEFV
ncbi:MAG: Thiosulfate sulfurtransferase [Sphingomonadales bacterium]|nr:Thiosulfate sulfurtransferase [Sphingomonadales bacterium]